MTNYRKYKTEANIDNIIKNYCENGIYDSNFSLKGIVDIVGINKCKDFNYNHDEIINEFFAITMYDFISFDIKIHFKIDVEYGYLETKQKIQTIYMNANMTRRAEISDLNRYIKEYEVKEYIVGKKAVKKIIIKQY